MNAESLLLLGAGLHLGMAIFHLFFARIFHWDSALSRLDFVNRQLLPVMNGCLTLAFLELAYLSWAHSTELVFTQLGHAILFSIAVFWFWRAVLQVWFFRLRHWLSWSFLALFSGAAFIYAYAGWQAAKIV